MTARPGTVLRRLENPAATLLLAAALLFDLFHLPDDPLHGRYSAARRWATTTLGTHAVPTYRPASDELIALFENGEFRRLHPEEESWDEASRLFAQRPQDMVQLVATYTGGSSGLWALTRSHRTVRLVGMIGSAVPADAAAALRQRFAGEFLSECGEPLSPGARSSLAATGEGTDAAPVWAGYLHNGVSAAALVLLAVSLRWVPREGRRWRAARRARALGRHRCPRCGYSTHDLPGPVCPECGSGLGTG